MTIRKCAWSRFDLFASGKDQFVVVEEVIDALVHLLEGFEVDIIEDHLALTASQLFESLGTALLHDLHDLLQLLLTQLAQPLMETVLLGLRHLLNFR